MSQKVNLDKETVENLIFREYGLPVLKLKKVRGVYKATTEFGVFAFKNAEELNDLLFINDCLEQVKSHGFPNLPTFVPTVGGELILHYGGNHYLLERWIDAQEISPDFSRVESLAAALADYHHAARRLIPAIDSCRYGWGLRAHFLKSCLSRIHEWRNKQPVFVHTSYGKEMFDFLQHRCEQAYAYVSQVSYSELISKAPEAAVLCHGSLHHKNILVDVNEKIWFIDPESMIYAERVLDLAQLIHYHAPAYGWDVEIVQRFLGGYESRLNKPLLKEEWSCFMSYLAFPRRLQNAMFQFFSGGEPRNASYLKLKKTIEQEWPKEPFFIKYGPQRKFAGEGG